MYQRYSTTLRYLHTYRSVEDESDVRGCVSIEQMATNKELFGWDEAAWENRYYEDDNSCEELPENVKNAASMAAGFEEDTWESHSNSVTHKSIFCPGSGDSL